MIVGVTVLGVNQFRKYKQRNPPNWCNVKEVWFDSQQPFVMGRRALCDVCLRLIILRILLISLFLGGTPGGGGGRDYVCGRSRR